MDTLFFSRYASIIHRHGNRYFDCTLAPDQIGCGQQFFLARIAENEGVSMYELAAIGRFDKGTVTKAVRKLEELGYIRCEVDEKDRRIRHLYTTEAALPVLERLRECRRKWNAALVQGMTEQEIAQASRLLQKMAANACQYHPEGEN